MGSRQIVLVSKAGFSVLNTGIFWREAKTKRLFSQCTACRVLKLLSWELLANTAAVGDVVLNVHKTLSLAPSCKEGMGKSSS